VTDVQNRIETEVEIQIEIALNIQIILFVLVKIDSISYLNHRVLICVYGEIASRIKCQNS
jgi:hypothetical protein